MKRKVKRIVKKTVKRKLPRVLIKSKRQTGKRKSLKRDEGLKAMFSGKRLSKNGKVYYEYRRNRTDVKRDKKGWI